VGEILVSTNGVNWTSPTGQTNWAFTGVVYANGLFVAVGSGGGVWTSSDGYRWTGRFPATGWFLRLAYGRGTFVAVGAGGLVMTSADATNWTQRATGTSEYLRDIEFGNNRFVAVGDRGAIISSPDGINWTAESTPVTHNLYAVAHGQGAFLAAGAYGTLLVSPALEPVITSPLQAVAIAGQPLHFQITVLQGPVLGYGATGLPAWAGINSTGLISGIALPGTNLTTIYATNEFGVGSAQITLRVLSAWNYEAWTAAYGLTGPDATPAADPDHDGLPNVMEYALASHPLQSDSAQIRPSGRVVNVAGQSYLAVVHRRLKGGTPDIIYQVTRSTAAMPWQYSTNTAVVGAPADFGDYEEITIRSTLPLGSSPQEFLRLGIMKP
jgi:hypothetical protein